MFKIAILQSLHNLSDARVEFQVKNRLSFMRFLDLSLADRVPDEKTIRAFREQLKSLGLADALFARFDGYLRAHGFSAKKWQIVDASIIAAPKQRNTRDENKEIKEGFEPDSWNEAKRRQKDIDARWTKKNGVSHFGYKNHVQIDAGGKFIRDFEVTGASVHDSQVFEELLDGKNSSREVFADSACRAKKSERNLEAIGLARAKVKIGLRNLAYNLDRYASFMNEKHVTALLAE